MATPAQAEEARRVGARSTIVFAFALLAGLILAWELRELLLLIYASVLFAIVIDPLVAGVEDWGWGERHLGHGAALAVVLAGAAVGGALLLAILVPPLVREATALIEAWPTVSSNALAAVQRLPGLHHLNLSPLESDLAAAGSWALEAVQSLATGVADGCTILLLTVYLVAEGRETRDWCLGMIAPGPRRRLALTLDRGQRRMRGWLLAQSALALCMGVASLAAFAALRLPDFYALALLAALLSFVPVLGPLTAAAVAGAVAGVQSWFALGGVLMFFAVYEGFENAYLVPKVMRNAVDLPGLAIILALAVGAALGGVLGAVLAVPTAALVAELLGEYARQPEEE
ncbi:MAG TPA: AI-2E family transporter [Terriglobales bacterium]|nr:AI-2E family transporter [Terriglobales bacterium]